jgi:PAS domain S-box-containing protein
MWEAFAGSVVTLAVLGGAMALVSHRRRVGAGPARPPRPASPEQTAELEREKVRLELDLERHKQIEEALRHSEAKYRDLIEHANDVILIAQDGVMKFANPRTHTLLGYKSEDLANIPFSDLIHAEDRNLVLERYMRRLRGEDVPARYNFRVVGRDGRIFWVEINSVIVDWEGRPATLCFLRDVTDQIRAAEQIREAKQAAEEANRAKSRFLANMSHELRTPMNGIIGLTELALAGPLDEESRRHLEGVLESAEFMLSLINTILDFSKIEASKLTLSPLEFRLRGEVSDTIKIVALRAAEKGLRLACHIRPNVPDYLVGDASRLRQVLFNLVGNAIKFTEQGEVVLLVEVVNRDAQRIELRFTVCDTGIGIPLEKRQLIFEPFQQADDSISRQYGGTGLGLAICRQLIQMMGGELQVESEVGRGSRFHFMVPFQIPQNRQTVHLAPPELRGATILVVDEHASTREAICDMLLAWELNPTPASRADEGVERLQNRCRDGNPFALALVDDEVEAGRVPLVLERVRKASPTTRLIAVERRSKMGGLLQRSAHHRRLLSARVAKPVIPSELFEAVLRAMDRSVAQPSQAEPLSIAPATESLRVLLVEDNAINQRVAINWLEKRGHQVTLATNGEAALARLDGEAFDVILMDLEMPGLGGTETTARIRQREAVHGGHIPIVAMTAHALEGDRERCLAVGMDDYLAKPIRAAELFRVVERFGRQGSLAGVDEISGTIAREPNARPPDGQQPPFDQRNALEAVGNDPMLLRELIDIFLADSPKWLRDLDSALGDHRAEDARRVAHSLKNSAGYFAAQGVRGLAFDLERAAGSGDLAKAARIMGELSAEVNRLNQGLAAFRHES